MSYKSITFDKKEHIASIKLGHAEAARQSAELAEACNLINQDDDIYVVVLRGIEAAQAGAAGAISGVKQPVIAVIEKDALGEALELALACDIRLASDKARFGMPQIASGLIPTDGGTQRLPRIVGKAKALEMVLTGETIDAGAALETGLAHKVVPEDALTAKTKALTANLAAKSPISLRFAKEVVNKGMDMTLEQGLRLEADMYFIMHTTSDRTEGITSFREKRKPVFKGE
jgi:enoyl-CoA hydratase